MEKGAYDPEKHHRRSIRLKGHDYAGGGLYFITLCAHRDAIAAMQGKPFAPMKALIAERMAITAEKNPQMEWGESIIMPDHFHALIRIRKGGSLDLGNIIGGFKAGVSREWRRDEAGKAGKAGLARTGGIAPALPREMRIWHRNYYEMIVRSAEAEAKIAEYIRMNPWRCVQELGSGLRGMGNPALWNAEKMGVLCSRNAPRPKSIPKAAVYLGGFHSPMEKEILEKLLEHKRPVIWCPAWGLERAAFAPGVREAQEQNRMLILEMRDTAGNLAAAEARNRFVLEHADQRWISYVQPGGMLAHLLREG
ncbi:hypothetical protein PDESU_00324 [Pontiella desulfatans]|uniref:Transposase IS200-like domain-containing protein n=1 Tax=Pontiella desulfatans TaxID=2750659 RepID=A0A6C2TVT8_PONDE|nr:transposase [Pontiella desulfatans]VGO11778.1 hypothetical protein PDESU_00324 [Pontiella desulfatans]